MTSPSWIGQLTDPTLSADMTLAASSGVVSEVSMAKLFTDLANALSAAHSTLSSSQLTDLQTIAANLNLGESASAYLTYIVDALIDGNSANLTWRGGAASASPLGNLAQGFTSVQLSELVGKWFYGTDLPSVTNLTGINAGSISYSPVGTNLFGGSGPQITDINQGQIGDCYLCSSLAEVALQNPGAIESMITSNGNNTYSVRFFVNGIAQYVTVNNQLPNGGTIFDHGPALWGALVEKAYAQLQTSADLTGGAAHYYGNSYATIGAGGYSWYSLEQITGATSITNFVSNYNHSSWVVQNLAQNLSIQTTTVGNDTQAVLSMLISDLAGGNDVVLSSYTNAVDANGKTTLVASHAFSIYGYDNTSGLLELRNPWGSASNQSWDTTFEINLATLLAAGDVITVDNLTGVPLSSQASNVLVANVAAEQASSTITTITVLDSVANVMANFGQLSTESKLASISLTDQNPIFNISNGALLTDASILQKIAGTFAVNVIDTGVHNINTAYFSDIAANYSITILNSTANELKHVFSSAGPASDATYLNVSRLQFADTMVALDVGPTQTAGSAYMLYQAAFNRTPDAGGLGYWIAQLDKGANIITNVAQSFLNSPEFIAQYGANPSNATYVNDLYQNVLHRAGDAGGIAYWNQQLNSGAASKAFVLEQFATLPEGAANVASTIAHGIAYTMYVG